MTSINELQAKVDLWIKTHGVRYFDELTNLAMLVEEVGELSRLVGRIYGEQSFRKGQAPLDIKSALADEMSDVLFVLVCLANQMDIDLEEAMEENLLKKTVRDGDRHLGNTKLHP